MGQPTATPGREFWHENVDKCDCNLICCGYQSKSNVAPVVQTTQPTVHTVRYLYPQAYCTSVAEICSSKAHIAWVAILKEDKGRILAKLVLVICGPPIPQVQLHANMHTGDSRGK